MSSALSRCKVQTRMQVADLFASGKREPTLEDIASVLPFALDKFQAQSVEVLLRGSSVVVSAPTGAGKTVIAEAGTIAVLARYAAVIHSVEGTGLISTSPPLFLSLEKIVRSQVRYNMHTHALLLCRGQRVIYTTPLKALSNQKLYEMRQRFGSDMVGLQTGDASLNVDSSVVVMTTEVLRNIMYRTDATTSGAAPSTT